VRARARDRSLPRLTFLRRAARKVNCMRIFARGIIDSGTRAFPRIRNYRQNVGRVRDRVARAALGPY